MGSHSVISHPTELVFPPLPQPKWRGGSTEYDPTFSLVYATPRLQHQARLGASEVTTLWRYTNLFIIIIIINLTLAKTEQRGSYGSS